MKVLKILAAFLFILTCRTTVAQLADRPKIHLSEKTAESAFFEEYFHLSRRIYDALWSGRIKAYRDSTFKESFTIGELEHFTTTIENQMVINPGNPDDPDDIIELAVKIPYDPYSVFSIATKGEVVFYGYSEDRQLLLRKLDVVKILSPSEYWLFSHSDKTPLNRESVPEIAGSYFLQLQKTVYLAIGLDKIKKYRNDSLSSLMTKEQAYERGSVTEYRVRWKDSSDERIEQTNRLIDSLSAAHGQQVYLPFDPALHIVDTARHPFIPETGLAGLDLSMETSVESFSFTYSIAAFAPTYLPPGSGIELPGPWPMFWLKKNDVLSLLSKDQKIVLETVYAFALKAYLDPSFDNLHYGEEFEP